MKSIYIILLILSLGGLLHAQQTNPFDIRTTDIESATPPDVEGAHTNSLMVDVSPGRDLSQPREILTRVRDTSSNPFEKRVKTQDLIYNVQADVLLSPKEVIPTSVPQKRDTRLLVLVYCLVMFVIITLAISLDRRRFVDIMRSLINSNSIKTLHRDKPWFNGQEIILSVVFVFNAGFMVWLYLIKACSGPVVNLFFIIATVVLVYVIRHSVMWILARVYPLGNEVELQSYSISLHNISLGVLLLPMILALEFLTNVGYQTMGLVIVMLIVIIYFLRQAKGLFLAINMRGLNLLYFFIYLCALEIAPILVTYKWLSGVL